MKNKKEGGFGAFFNSPSLPKVFTAVLTAYSALGCLSVFIFKRIFPMPLAEISAIAYGYINKGALINSIVFTFILTAAFLLLFLLCLERFRKGKAGIILKCTACAVIFFDAAIHAYVFFLSSSFSFIYLFSFLLDILLAGSVIYEKKNY